MPCSSEDDAMTRATSSADGKEMSENKAIFGVARRTERSLQIKKGLMCKQDENLRSKKNLGETCNMPRTGGLVQNCISNRERADPTCPHLFVSRKALQPSPAFSLLLWKMLQTHENTSHSWYI